uniref:HAUS augmin-like complex subunit 6 N-terminal domain-containing protein n=1 Tax=Timema cristinae TaxID=61476 RepID=A0A7R9CA50_TIMCR|nr:unnamed protein product [Timema cristinae]
MSGETSIPAEEADKKKWQEYDSHARWDQIEMCRYQYFVYLFQTSPVIMLERIQVTGTVPLFIQLGCAQTPVSRLGNGTVPGMFRLPNAKQFFKVVIFLLEMIDPKMMKELSIPAPYLGQMQEKQFRTQICAVISKLSKNFPEAQLPHILTSHLQSPGGDRIANLIWKLSLFAQVQSLRRDGIEVEIYPDLGSSISGHTIGYLASLTEENVKVLQNGQESLNKCLSDFQEQERLKIVWRNIYRELLEEKEKIRRRIVQGQESLEALVKLLPLSTELKERLCNVEDEDVITEMCNQVEALQQDHQKSLESTQCFVDNLRTVCKYFKHAEDSSSSVWLTRQHLMLDSKEEGTVQPTCVSLTDMFREQLGSIKGTLEELSSVQQEAPRLSEQIDRCQSVIDSWNNKAAQTAVELEEMYDGYMKMYWAAMNNIVESSTSGINGAKDDFNFAMFSPDSKLSLKPIPPLDCSIDDNDVSCLISPNEGHLPDLFKRKGPAQRQDYSCFNVPDTGHISSQPRQLCVSTSVCNRRAAPLRQVCPTSKKTHTARPLRYDGAGDSFWDDLGEDSSRKPYKCTEPFADSKFVGNEDNDTSLCYALPSSSAEVSIQSFAPNVQPSELREDALEMEFNQDPNKDQPKPRNSRKSLDLVIQRYKDFLKRTEKPN